MLMESREPNDLLWSDDAAVIVNQNLRKIDTTLNEQILIVSLRLKYHDEMPTPHLHFQKGGSQPSDNLKI